MDKTELRSGSPVSAEASEVLSPREKAITQRSKFLQNQYKHRAAGKEYPYESYSTTPIGSLQKLLLRVSGWSITTLNLGNAEDFSKFNQLMGRANRSPRMSLTNLFKKENIQVIVQKKGNQTILRIGTWVDKEFIGVSTGYEL